MTKLFTITELKMLKMRHIEEGMSEVEAESFIEEVILQAEKNHKKTLKEKKSKKLDFAKEFDRMRFGKE